MNNMAKKEETKSPLQIRFRKTITFLIIYAVVAAFPYARVWNSEWFIALAPATIKIILFLLAEVQLREAKFYRPTFSRQRLFLFLPFFLAAFTNLVVLLLSSTNWASLNDTTLTLSWMNDLATALAESAIIACLFVSWAKNRFLLTR